MKPISYLSLWRKWFGAADGKSGAAEAVEFVRNDDRYILSPLGGEVPEAPDTGPSTFAPTFRSCLDSNSKAVRRNPALSNVTD